MGVITVTVSSFRTNIFHDNLRQTVFFKQREKIYVAGFTVRKSEANPIDQYRMYRRRNLEDTCNPFFGMQLYEFKVLADLK